MVSYGIVRGLRRGMVRGPGRGVNGDPLMHGRVFPGSMPTSIGELNVWSQSYIWDFAHNYKDITGSPNTLSAISGSSSFQLTRLGASQATVLAAPQSNYETQAGITITTSSQTLYKQSLNWSHHATIPTVYLCTFKFSATPTTAPYFFSGMAGDGKNGFYIQAHATNGIRAGIGDGVSAFVNTSYIGGTSLYDSQWHTLAFCVDKANGKVKLSCESYMTQSTGLTIGSPTALFCTIGATYDGDSAWGQPVSYLFSARGQNASAYTNLDTILDNFEGARVHGG